MAIAAISSYAQPDLTLSVELDHKPEAASGQTDEAEWANWDEQDDKPPTPGRRVNLLVVLLLLAAVGALAWIGFAHWRQQPMATTAATPLITAQAQPPLALSSPGTAERSSQTSSIHPEPTVADPPPNKDAPPPPAPVEGAAKPQQSSARQTMATRPSPRPIKSAATINAAAQPTTRRTPPQDQISLAASPAEAFDTSERWQERLEQNPDDAYVHFMLGNAYARRERWRLAEKHYATALRIDPRVGDYAFNRAISLEHLGQYTDADRYYHLALSLSGSGVSHFDHQVLRRRLMTAPAKTADRRVANGRSLLEP